MTGPPTGDRGEGALLRVTVVPGASRTRIVGPHGDRWKVAVAAPAERGAANDAVVRLIASTCEVPRAAVQVISGRGSRRKGLSGNKLCHFGRAPGCRIARNEEDCVFLTR